MKITLNDLRQQIKNAKQDKKHSFLNKCGEERIINYSKIFFSSLNLSENGQIINGIEKEYTDFINEKQIKDAFFTKFFELISIVKEFDEKIKEQIRGLSQKIEETTNEIVLDELKQNILLLNKNIKFTKSVYKNDVLKFNNLTFDFLIKAIKNFGIEFLKKS